MYLYIFDATEVSEVCYYADPIPSVEVTLWRHQWDAESDTESNTDSAERHIMDNGGPREGDRHYSIDAKLKELQQTTTTRQSTLIDSDPRPVHVSQKKDITCTKCLQAVSGQCVE